MTVTPRAAGDVLTAAIFNTKIEAPLILAEIPDGLITALKLGALSVTAAKLGLQDVARVRHGANQTVLNNTYTVLDFTTEVLDPAGMHAASGTTQRLTAIRRGMHLFGGCVQVEVNAVGIRAIALRVNGTTYVAQHDGTPGSAFGWTGCIVGCWHLNAGDYVELVIYQNSGSTLAATAAGDYAPTFWIARVGDSQ